MLYAHVHVYMEWNYCGMLRLNGYSIFSGLYILFINNELFFSVLGHVQAV